jgi:predicted Zn-dependent protease
MGHALLAGQDTDHCADPDCIMYWGVEDWDLKSFGPGSCEHKNGGDLNIGAYGVVYNGP